MKVLTIIMVSMLAQMSCTKDDIALDPKTEFINESSTELEPLKLLYLVDGVELKTRQELLAITGKEHVTTLFAGNSTLAVKYGDRAKYGVAIITTKQ